MRVSIPVATIIASILFSSAALAAPAEEKRNGCVVNAVEKDGSWGEWGLTRHRVSISTDKPDYDMHQACSFWYEAATKCAAIHNNVQCYNHEDKGWVVDDSEVAGPAGSTAISCIIDKFKTDWGTAIQCVVAQ